MDNKEFYAISEVCNNFNINAHTLRYWEGKGLINPIRLQNGQRRYSKQDLILIEKLKDLIFSKKIGTKAVKRIIKNKTLLNENNKNLKTLVLDLKKEVKLLLKMIE